LPAGIRGVRQAERGEHPELVKSIPLGHVRPTAPVYPLEEITRVLGVPNSELGLVTEHTAFEVLCPSLPHNVLKHSTFIIHSTSRI
jgi:hypothetical protein